MIANRLKRGVNVIINKSLQNTHTAFGSNDEMYKMVGRHFRIEGVREKINGPAAKICSYDWHPEDLTEVCPRKRKQIFHFDVKELQL